MATINTRGKSKILNWREDGKQYRISLGEISTQEAEAIRLSKELELAGKLRPGTTLTVRALSLEYLPWYASQFPSNYLRTESILEQHVLPVFGDKRLTDLTVRECEQHMQSRRESGAKRNTYVKDIRTLKAMLNKAIEWNYLRENPISAVRYPAELDAKPPRFYTKDELESIYCASPYHWHWWKLLANTGMRRGEAARLKWENVSDNALHIVSSEKERTKSGRWRVIPLNSACRQALVQFDKLRDSEYVFPRVHSRSMTRSFQRCLDRASNIAGPRGSIHCLRHTFCSHLVMSGVPLTVVQKLAGHASHTTTERYAHVSPASLLDAVETLDL